MTKNRHIKRRAALVGWAPWGLLGLCAGAAGCSVSARLGPPESGSLTVDWSIEGSTNPGTCNQKGAPTFALIVYDDSGANVGQFDSPCAAFTNTITLTPGRYSAGAVLLNDSGSAVSTTVPIDGLDIESGTDLDAPVDFPSNSFAVRRLDPIVR
jgi:hypothetical protein